MEKTINMGLVEIKETHFNLNFVALEEIKEIEPQTLSVGMRTLTQIDPQKNLVLIYTGAKYEYENKDLISLDILTVFSVGDLKEMINKEKKHPVNFNKEVLPTLLGISVGNLRGILHTKTLNTKLEHFPLILIDTRELVKRNIIEEIDAR